MERHPKELPGLFLVEMWERFSFYLMLGILALYITDKDLGGLGMSGEAAGGIVGTYMALVYFTPFIGGMIADRVFGYRKAIVLGAVLMCLGHISLAFHDLKAFYLGLGLLIVGNGFFKPNISTLLGRLYPQGSKLKDAGFNIFYVGINLGAFFCNFVAAFLRNKWGWHAAFGSAGVGMAIGLVIFLTMYRSLARAEAETVRSRTRIEGEIGLSYMVSRVLPFALGFAGVGWFYVGGMTATFLLACVPIAVFFLTLWARASSEERGPLGALLVISVLLIPFWMVFNLSSTALSFWAEQQTDRAVSPAVAELLTKVDLAQDAPPSYFFNASADVPRPERAWFNVVPQDKVEAEKTAYVGRLKDGYEAAGPVPVTREEFDAIYKKSAGRRLPSGRALKLANAELFQSVNPAFVMLLTPLLVGLWHVLRSRRKEPNTVVKMGIGMMFAAAAMIVMMEAVFVGGEEKMSAMWLIGAYGVITVGELCLSPIGLSLVSKLAPRRMAAVMMGGFFLSIAIGNKLSGFVGGLWEKIPHDLYFASLGALCVAFGLLILFLSDRLKQYLLEE